MSDELDREVLDAWTVEPLSEDFDDRVMAAWDGESEPANDQARSWPWRVAVVAAAAALCLWMLWPRSEIADAVVVQADASAQVRYRPGSGRAEQHHGTVHYEVQPGTPFVVHTPAADVSVHGTRFTVEMLTMNDERRRKYLGAAALAMGGAAVAVYVTAGEVEVHNEHGRTTLVAGESAVASAHAAPSSTIVDEGSAPQAAPRRRAGIRTGSMSAEQRADVQRRLAAALSAPGAPAEEAAAEAPPPEPIKRELPPLERDYIQSVVSEDLLPIARECYESALEDEPELAGKLVVRFTIVGDPSVGGIVEDAVLDETSTLRHPGLSECMTESTASLLFEPPEDGGRVVVSYPFVFEPR